MGQAGAVGPQRARRKPKREEAERQKAVLAGLQAQGCIAVRVNSGQIVVRDPETGEKHVVRLARKGTSDVLAGVPMRVHTASGEEITLLVLAAVECKREGEKPTDEQRAFLEDVRARGGISIVARGVDDVTRLLGAVERAGARTRAS